MIYFVSDVHLGFFNREKDKDRESIFLDFLKMIRKDCEELFLLGDIFDYWFDYKTVIPRDFYRVLAELHLMRMEGIPITYLMGNHDFGHYTFFKDELGIDVIEEDVILEITGKKFYLAHGDGKIPTDKGYNFIKKILRNKFNQKLYRMLHPDLGIRLASGSSQKSRKHTSKVQYEMHDGMKEFALAKIDEGADVVIFGHRHIPEIVEYKNSKYINPGDWLKHYTYLTYDGNELNLMQIKNKDINQIEKYIPLKK